MINYSGLEPGVRRGGLRLHPECVLPRSHPFPRESKSQQGLSLNPSCPSAAALRVSKGSRPAMKALMYWNGFKCKPNETTHHRKGRSCAVAEADFIIDPCLGRISHQVFSAIKN